MINLTGVLDLACEKVNAIENWLAEMPYNQDLRDVETVLRRAREQIEVRMREIEERTTVSEEK